MEVKGYHLIRQDYSRRGGEVACDVKASSSCNQKSNFCYTHENVFINIFLPKLKPTLSVLLYRPPGKT